MASTTPNIGLTLPTGAEKVSRQVINTNNTIIDSKMGAVPDGKNLQGEIDALNSKIASSADTVVSNIAGVKSALQTFAASLNRGESKLVTIVQTNSSETNIMRASARYSGYLCKNYTHSFSWLATNPYADVISISFDGSSTWTINKINSDLEKIATATWNGITFIVTRRGRVKQLRFEGFCTAATTGETVNLTWTYETGYSYADIHSATSDENFYNSINRSDFSNELVSFYFGGGVQFYPKTAAANVLFRGAFTYL